jgi:hypothetical protein
LASQCAADNWGVAVQKPCAGTSCSPPPPAAPPPCSNADKVQMVRSFAHSFADSWMRHPCNEVEPKFGPVCTKWVREEAARGLAMCSL